jgi:hypothetical protein
MGIVDVSLGANQSASGMVGVGTGDCTGIGGVVALMPLASRGRTGGGGTEGDGDGNDGGDGGTDATTLGPGVGDATGENVATGTAEAVGDGATLGGSAEYPAFDALASAATLQTMTMAAQAKLRRFTRRAFAPRCAAAL